MGTKAIATAPSVSPINLMAATWVAHVELTTTIQNQSRYSGVVSVKDALSYRYRDKLFIIMNRYGAVALRVCSSVLAACPTGWT